VKPSATLATWLVDRLVERGLTNAVLSPGSRNAPLSFALAAESRVTLHTRIDERTAGFLALGLGNLQPLANRRLAHGLMRAEGDQNVENLRHARDLAMERLKQKADRRGAGAIGDDEQDAFAAIILRGAGFRDDFGDVLRGQCASCRRGF